MEITCPRCGAPLPAGDVDAVTGLVRCRACDEVFRHAPAAGHAPPPPREVVPGPAPTGITVLDDGHARTLFYRWRSKRTVYVTVFSTIWIGVTRHVLAGLEAGTSVRIIVEVALALGICLAYWALAEWVNTTTFTLAGGWLRMRHGPVPWPGAVDLPAAAIRQLYAHDTTMPQENGRDSHQYSVRVLLRDGSTRTLMSNLRSPAATWYIERRLEAWLGLADEPVAGEMPVDGSYVSW